ncbi:Zinc finger with UFM1-specific peptidase domain protein [Beauveria bassiana]|nr:Zinc finger with UFM1-specific peptidase domain protein [Beauveria bassiana]
MGTRSENQPRHSAVIWNRIVVHTRQKLYRLNGRHGQWQDNTREDAILKHQLGKFAHEDQMPLWLRHYLSSRDDNSKDGSFCGYRNIQMLISYLILATETGPRSFPDGVPDIFQLQNLIEAAWDNGHNTRGRQETGGIKGTRKFIGTQEAQALFLNLNIK